MPIMKIRIPQNLTALTLTCLALAAPSRLLAASDFTVSTFDSDLGSNPYATNLWTDTAATALVWTNVGLPGGSLDSVHDWALGAPTGDWQWEEDQANVRPWDDATNADRGLNLSAYQSIEFDAMLKTGSSVTNAHGDYGGINIAAQGDPYWGNNGPDGVGWTGFGTATLMPATTNGGWVHYSIPTVAFQGTLSTLIFQFFNWANSNRTMHTEVLVDNVQFIAASGPPPKMQYIKAPRGLNIWAGDASSRNGIETIQDSSRIVMWPQSAPAVYSFTVSSFPTDPARTNVNVYMYLLPGAPTESAPDWNETNCIWMNLSVDQGGIASWTFHWKTNAPYGLGQYYVYTNQITITNPTPIGTWSLNFDSDTSVSMVGPTQTTNFVMGVNPAVPDISGDFPNPGTVYLGVWASDTNVSGLNVVFGNASAGAVLGNQNVTNNWLVESSTNGWNWSVVANSPFYLVPTNNCWWVNWNLPDAGFALQTNTVAIGSAANWSTNHGLPPGGIFGTHKGVLVSPTDLPASSKLFFRMSRPGY